MRSKKIFYISGYSNFSTNYANVSQVLAMCNAFVAQSCVKLVLMGFVNDRTTAYQTLVDNKCARSFTILPIKFRKLTGIYLIYDLIGFLVGFLAIAFGWTVYTRSIRVAYLISYFRLPVCVEVHSIEKKKFLKKISENKNIIIVVISNNLKAELNKFQGKAEIIVEPDCGMRWANLIASQAEQNKVPSDLLDIIFISSNNPGKGLNLLKKIAPLDKRNRFHVYGISDENTDNLNFYGFVAKEELSRAMGTMHLAIAPFDEVVRDNAGNRIDRYMSPLKIFDYMAHGLPIICSDLEVLNEVLEHDKTCKFADPRNPYDFIQKINEFREDQELYRAVHFNLLFAYEKFYNWDARACRILKKI